MRQPITIRTNILSNFIFVVFVVSVSLLGLQYYFAKQLAIERTGQTLHHLTDKVTAVIQGRDTLAKETLSLIEQYPDISKPAAPDQQISRIRRMSTPMRRNNNIYAVYTGFGNGELFEVINLISSPHLRQLFDAPADSRWLLVRMLNGTGQRMRHLDFLDANFELLQSRQGPTDYVATERPWYTQVQDHAEAVRSAPYLFANIQQSGITFSKRLAGGESVLAIDFSLKNLNVLFKQLKFSPTNEIVMFGADGGIAASSESNEIPIDEVFKQAIVTDSVGEIMRYERDGKQRLAMLNPLSVEAGEDTWLGFSVDEQTLLAPYIENLYTGLATAMVLLLAIFPVMRITTNRIVRPINALIEETKKISGRHFDEVRPINTNIIELRALSDSLVSMSDSIQRYQQDQKDLMDSFIKLIAAAIDAKSPYTGGHCKRVPIIAKMLAQAASDEDQGLFKSFKIKGKDAWLEFERGAWLHDCGKITTPEYVVDKATKLETIYNRIHEIRTRFEVIRRDIEIRYYQRLMAGEDTQQMDAWRTQQQQQLVEDFAFIARCNVGSEFMSDADQARIESIGKRPWTRYFDNCAGLATDELMRHQGQPECPLPAAETLLSDKPEHQIERVGFDEAAYRAQGFKTEVPELLYDRGEVYNLCIQKGTLTPEERFKIEEHIIMTIKMLERLPLPDNMKNIPEFAGTHHETLIGTGYPRQLSKGDLSIPARIMAIADIFEALTASDRPYKEGKTLSQALEIMGFMVKDQHIDAELYDLFLRSAIPETYGQQYLKPEQLDARHVSIDQDVIE